MEQGKVGAFDWSKIVSFIEAFIQALLQMQAPMHASASQQNEWQVARDGCISLLRTLKQQIATLSATCPPPPLPPV